METPETGKAEAGLLASLKFCERCKASIPESEFRDGHALHMGKRHVHVDCLLKRSATLPVTALLLGLAGVALGAYAVSQAKASPKGGGATPPAADVTQQVQRAVEGALAPVQGELAGIRKQVSDLSGTPSAVAALDERMRAGREGLEKKAQDAAAAVDVLSARFGKLEESLNALVPKVDAAASLDGKFNALSQAVADVRKDLNKLKAGAPPTPPDGEQPPR